MACLSAYIDKADIFHALTFSPFLVLIKSLFNYVQTDNGHIGIFLRKRKSKIPASCPEIKYFYSRTYRNETEDSVQMLLVPRLPV